MNSLTKILLSIFIVFIANANIFCNVLIAKVPFELFGEHIFFSLNVDSSEELDFIFDTGAGATIINDATAKKIGLHSNEATQVMGAGGIVDMQIYQPKPVILDGKRILITELIGANLWRLERGIGRRIDGIIGKDILDKYVVKIDYTNMNIELYSFHNYKYTEKGKRFNLNFINGLPITDFSLYIADKNKKLHGKFLLDSGAGMAMVFATPYAKEHKIIDLFHEYYISETTDITNLNSRAYNSLINQIVLGSFNLEDFPVQAMDAQHGVYAWTEIAGMLGNELLKRFNITFNYKDSCSYWEKNSLYGDVFNIDCSGIDIEKDMESGEIIVKEVISNSPASKAGIKVLDVIEEINNKNAKALSVPRVKKLFRKEGGSVELVIKRNDKTITVILQLAKLL